VNFNLRSVLCSLAVTTMLTACGGGGSSSGSSSTASGGTRIEPAPQPIAPVTPQPIDTDPIDTDPVEPEPLPAESLHTYLETPEEAARFLIQAGFGGTEEEIEALVGTDAADWIAAEMQKPATLTLPLMQAQFPTRGDTDFHHSRMLWEVLLTADDELRQRMAYALSQIFVISTDAFFDQGYGTAYYTDLLAGQAFGNYRSLLEDVTYSHSMASYLTYYRNSKGDAATGRMPDENYAREILQLFSIGLVELRLDGTPRVGSPETYTNDDILGLARVFTGLSGRGASFSYFDQEEDFRHHPLEMFDEAHSPLEKSFLGTTIPENTGGTETITQALDTIAAHPNVAPFISRQLIQRFTASSPSPDYVQRVARVFQSGRYIAPNGHEFGTGQRGDFDAVIAAILLDPSVHDDVQEINEGKVREPVIKFTQYVKSFDLSDVNIWNEGRFYNTSNPNDGLAQHPYLSPSVFNFYRPGYQSPGSETGELGLSAPELQIVNETSSLGFVNFIANYIMNRPSDPASNPGFQPDFSAEIALADDVEALVDHLNVKLTAGQLSESTKADIIDVVSTLDVDGDDADYERGRRAKTAILMVMASGAYAVQN